jgi:putative transposase
MRVFDQSLSGKSVKMLTLIDEFTKECLSREWFSSAKEAQVVIEKWRKFYNTERPHSSLAYMTPPEFKSKMEKTKSLAI